MSGLFSSPAEREGVDFSQAGGPPEAIIEKSSVGEKIALATVLAIALAVRLWNVLTNAYVVFPDETFQYLEQAHRLAFGYGVVPWEFVEGVRSWLLPGALAALMRLTALFRSGPEAYVLTIRLACAALSMTVPFVGFSLSRRRFALPIAMATGLLCALWYELVYNSPVVLSEVVATHVALWAIWLGDAPPDSRPIAARRISARRIAFSGALFGLACVLRYQYAPALFIAAACQSYWQHGEDRARWLPLCLGALASIGLFGGLLDLLTWGSPLQSVWLNFKLNALDGAAAALTTQPWYFMLSYLIADWGPATIFFAALAAFGAIEIPALGLAAVAVVALHSATPHKEVRFIYLATASMPMLMGLGLGRIFALQKLGRIPLWAFACVMAPLIAVYEGLWADGNASAPGAWRAGRNMTRAFEAAHADPGLCALGVGDIPVYSTGGYTYLDRAVPIYFEQADRQLRAVTPTFRLHFDVTAAGRSVPQFSPTEFHAHPQAFNRMIAYPAGGLPGYEASSCFGPGSAGDPEVCLFKRAGGCD